MTRLRGLAASAVFVVALGAPGPGRGNRPFELHDWLGRTWTHELVQFPLSPSQERRVRSGAALFDTRGRSVPYQVATGGPAGPRIAFHADLAPFGTSTYRLGPGAASRDTDLTVTETEDAIRIENPRVGIAIARRVDASHGPIAGIRTVPGRWIGGSSLRAGAAIARYEARILSRGPVYAEAACRLQLVGGETWEWRIRVDAGEPAVLVDERGAGGTSRTSVRLDLDTGLAPTHILHRLGRELPDDPGSVGRASAWKIADDVEPPFVLAPWLPWWKRVREGTWFGLYDEAQPDLLMIGAREPGTWVDPARGARVPELELDRDPTLGLTLPAPDGERKWMLAALDRAESLASLDPRSPHRAPAPQRLLIRYGDFPLDRIKDLVLAWPSGRARWPRQLVSAADLARHRASFRPEPAVLERLRREPPKPETLDLFVCYYVGTGDAALGAHLARTAVQWIQDSVDRYLDQDAQVTLGYGPHTQARLLAALNLADAILGSPHVSPDERARLLAQIAFLGYTVHRADYWSPERGFSANPNMTTSVAAYRAMIGGLIREHPLARSWIDGAVQELRHELETWSDADGGWTEAPHYAMVSYDHMLGVFRMAQLAGIDDSLYDPRMQRVIEWIAKISTPPDARVLGHRHLPPIGNTYVGESSGEFGLVAYLYRERDPAFSARMQWMQREQGDYVEPGVGGLFLTLAGYRTLLRDPTLPEEAPAWSSERFAETGVILRHRFPGPRETALHLIAGTNHQHYDDDSGSITVWGRGRIVADDFGYTGRAPADDHSMLVPSSAKAASVMRVEAFVPAPSLDYVRGVKPGWIREIAFVKHPGEDGPSYFVLADTPSAPGAVTWRLWLSAASIDRRDGGAVVRGREDVDTDVSFVRPTGIAWTTEERSRSTHGLDQAGRYGRVTTTQLGLVLTDERGERFLVTIFPRAKGDPAPAIDAIADGQGVRVETADGTDYVFLARQPIDVTEDDVSFRGTVGLVQRRAGGRLSITLGAPGAIRVGAHTLESDRPASRDW